MDFFDLRRLIESFTFVSAIKYTTPKNHPMKNLLIFCCTFALLSQFSCNPKMEPAEILKQISAIHLVEAPVARTIVVDGHFVPKDQGMSFQNVALTAVPISLEASDIVITDTIGLKPGDVTIEVTPSPSGANVIINANIQPGDYYCQTMNTGKMTCERGIIGTHLQTRQLTTLATYPAADHFASAASQNQIIIYQTTTTPSFSVAQVAQYSTDGQTICVYNLNGTLYVASKP